MAALWPSVKDRFDTNSSLSCFYCLGIKRGVWKKGPDLHLQNGVFRGGKGLGVGRIDKNFDLGAGSGVYGKMVVRRGH